MIASWISTPTKLRINPDNQSTWSDWMASRYARRMISREVSPSLRREDGSDDARLREEFDGQRGPEFPTDEALREIAEALSGSIENFSSQHIE